uniref:DNA-directed RNA polymerase I subunit RPA49 n=1 Tax=Chlamydomonas leiostraca TaxID=1034604 RepID=A0A7S0WZP6_9CHLO|mmetsp:Transcript_3572/g.8908  ORF Transcript_3572/g.8908 Transcript_3572/m.8908 type:complete len:460 (+) Transcript_3572:35-1414(+)
MGKSDKKRGADEPASQEPKRVKVEVLQPNEEQLPPIAAYFPAGLPQGVEHYEVYEHGSGVGANKKQLTILGKQGKVEYVGSTSGEDYTPGPQPCQYVLGVYNKESGQLSLMPIAGGRVIRMEPRLPGLQYTASLEPVGDDDGEETREERLAMNKKLVASFGSTRRVRQLNAREEGVVRVDKLGDAASALEGVMGELVAQAHASGLTKDKVMAAATQARALPPHDPAGTTPFTAYPPSHLIPDEIMGSLKLKPIMAFTDPGLVMTKENTPRLHPYAARKVKLMAGLQDREVAKTRARLIAFTSALLRLRENRSRMWVEGGDMDKLGKAVNVFSEVLEVLLPLFFHASPPDPSSGKVRWELAKDGETRLVAYICVTALLVEPTAVIHSDQFADLAKWLSLTPNDLQQRFREVGARVKSVALKDEEGKQVAGAERSYQVELLPDGSKALRDMLPDIKINKRK